MKKEVILAIAIGFALGLVITFGIWTANKSLKNLPSSQPTPTPVTVAGEPTTTASPNQAISLTLSSPADEALVNASKVTVSGQTTANAVVTILAENGQQIISADASGDFSAEVSLVAGYNVIRVVASDKDGNMVEQSVTITYSTQI